MNEEYEYFYDMTGRRMVRRSDGFLETWESAERRLRASSSEITRAQRIALDAQEFERDPADQNERARAAKTAVRNITGESGAIPQKPSRDNVGPNSLDAASVYMSRIAKALEIHAPVNDERPGKDRYCRYCSTTYPCDTVNALTGQA